MSIINGTMENNSKENNNLYIVKTKNNNSFYKSESCYTTDLYDAKFYNENEIPKELKDNPNHNIINLNSEEGLEIITSELQKSERYMSIKSHSLGEIICGLNKLKGLFKKVKKESY
jgi:cell division ATPase FtsA